MSNITGRIAVVVIHGMGNQYPMDTLRGFVDAIKPEASTLYSSPNRITEEKETRRLSFNSGPYDFYEYYWAHFIEEPGIFEILKWSANLLFIKKPSDRLKPHINAIRAIIVSVLLLMFAVGVLWYMFLNDYITDLVNITLFGTGLFVFFKVVSKLISGSVIGRINNSLGDVIKYTVPSPKNILTREQIRKNGIELLKNLHEAKNEEGNFKYAKIIIAAHSLGTIVAYDILTSLFAQYHRKYLKVPANVEQKNLQAIRDYYHNAKFSAAEYQGLQSALYDEYRRFGNEWRVSDFITMGSPLTHASMILAHSDKDVLRRKEQREFPTCPPQYDKQDDHFGFPAKFRTEAGEKVEITVLHHAAHFAETKWTNIYFKNDWIGGKLSNVFGPGIVDISVNATRKWTARVPLASHTKYWDKKNDDSLKTLKKIVNDICEM